MNKSMLVGSVLGAVLATTGGAIASYSFFKKEPEFAQVVAVQEVKETIKTPRQECREEAVKVPREECHDVTVTRQRPVQDSNRITGTVLGAVVGGALGHQVGGGRGKDAATVVGAAAGGYAGNQVQKGMQQRDTYTTTERRCKTVQEDKMEQKCDTVYDVSQKTAGYDVTYKLAGLQNTVRMGHHPGDKIPLKNGALDLSNPNAPAAVQPVNTASAQ